MTFATMTITVARQTESLSLGVADIKPYSRCCYASATRMVAGRPAPPGR